MAVAELDFSRRNGYIDASRFQLPPDPVVNVAMSDLISAEGALAPYFQQRLTNRLATLNRLPPDKKLHFKNPPGSHPESGAQYILEYTTGDWEIYAYILPPGETTSLHYHPKGVSEHYELVGGGFTLLLNGERVPVSRYVELGPFVDHQGITGSRPALILAMTYNPNHIPPGELHIKSARNWRQDWNRDRREILRDVELPQSCLTV